MDTFKKYGQNVDQFILNSLKPQYKDKASCRTAARTNAAAFGLDLVDGDEHDGNSTVNRLADLANFRCAGWTFADFAKLAGTLLMIVLFVIGVVLRYVPSSSTCQFCETDENNEKVCREGTPSECKRASMIGKTVVGAVIGVILSSIVYYFVQLQTKFRIYEPGYVFGDMLL